MEAVFHNLELVNRSSGVAVRHAQMRHRIQRSAPDQYLRRLPSKLPRTHSLCEERLHSKHLGFSQASPVVATFFFPLLAPDLPNPSQILIAYQPLLFAIAVLPYLRISTRRNGRLRLALTDGLIAIALVIRSIAADLLNLFLDLLKQRFKHLRIGDIISRYDRRDDFPSRLLRAQVQLAPGAVLRVAVLADFPFAFAEDFHARRIDHHGQRLILFAVWQGHLQGGTAPAQLAVIHHRQVEAEQFHHRQHQALGGAQREMIDLLERRHAQDSGVGVGARLARLAGFFSIAPSRQPVVTDPEGEASALHQRGVIVFPVAETVGLLGFLVLHKTRLPALSSPCFMQQSLLEAECCIRFLTPQMTRS